MDLWVIFITGLTVGGLTCLAVQGGLLASVIAAREDAELSRGRSLQASALPTLSFLAAKLAAYLVLGGVLGLVGESLQISHTTQVLMQFFAGLYMIAVALDLLHVHPIFRYVVIQPPRWVLRMVKSTSRSKDTFAPGVLGALTIFIPCGTTLAMEALAISSGSPVRGAAIMGAFTLGTVPLFLGIGLVTSTLGERFKARFLKVAALAVLYLGLTSVNGALIAVESPLAVSFAPTTTTSGTPTVPVTQGVQRITLNITSRGYSPQNIVVTSGYPVELTLSSSDTYNCALAFRIPSLKIAKNLLPNDTQTVTFTPQEKGDIAFTCSMGMYTGVIKVI